MFEKKKIVDTPAAHFEPKKIDKNRPKIAPSGTVPLQASFFAILKEVKLNYHFKVTMYSPIPSRKGIGSKLMKFPFNINL